MKYLFSICLVILVSCSPKINYLGESYSPTTDVEVFFDEVDIQKDYKVMGLISANNSDNTFLDLDDINNGMIKEARKKGADAILFLNLSSDSFDGFDRHLVEAKLLKYNR